MPSFRLYVCLSVYLLCFCFLLCRVCVVLCDCHVCLPFCVAGICVCACLVVCCLCVLGVSFFACVCLIVRPVLLCCFRSFVRVCFVLPFICSCFFRFFVTRCRVKLLETSDLASYLTNGANFSSRELQHTLHKIPVTSAHRPSNDTYLGTHCRIKLRVALVRWSGFSEVSGNRDGRSD